MSRLAGSSGTQKVCETTKSKNRTRGKRWNKSCAKSRAHLPPAEATTSLHSLTPCQAARVSMMSKSGRLRTVADVLSNDPARLQKTNQSQRRQLTFSGGVPRGAFVRSLVLSMSHLELIASCPPSRPRNGTTSCTVTASLTRGLRVLRMFGQSRLFDGGCQQIATTAIVRST